MIYNVSISKICLLSRGYATRHVAFLQLQFLAIIYRAIQGDLFKWVKLLILDVNIFHLKRGQKVLEIDNHSMQNNHFSKTALTIKLQYDGSKDDLYWRIGFRHLDFIWCIIELRLLYCLNISTSLILQFVTWLHQDFIFHCFNLAYQIGQKISYDLRKKISSIGPFLQVLFLF